MSENRDARLQSALLFDIVADLLPTACALCHNDEDVALAFLIGILHILADGMQIVLFLRYEDVLCPAGDA